MGFLLDGLGVEVCYGGRRREKCGGYFGLAKAGVIRGCACSGGEVLWGAQMKTWSLQAQEPLNSTSKNCSIKILSQFRIVREA